MQTPMKVLRDNFKTHAFIVYVIQKQISSCKHEHKHNHLERFFKRKKNQISVLLKCLTSSINIYY